MIRAAADAAAAQGPALNSEVVQAIILLSLIVLGLVGLSLSLQFGALARRPLLPADEPAEPMTPADGVRLLLVLAALAAETTIAITGALGVL